jgi:prevent-host-death family protein
MTKTVEMIVKTAALREDLADILRRVSENRARATITRHGKIIAVMVSQADVQELDELRQICTTLAYLDTVE